MSEYSFDNSNVYSLQIVDILHEAFYLSTKKIIPFAKSFIPFFIVLITALIYWRFQSPFILETDSVNGSFKLTTNAVDGWLMKLIFTGIFVNLAFFYSIICCFRIVLKPTGTTNSDSFLRWLFRIIHFSGWYVAISVLATLIGVFFTVFLYIDNNGNSNSVLFNILNQTVSFLLLYLIARWSIVLPASAIDDRKSIRWSWKISSGNGLQLLLLSLFSPISILFLFFKYLPKIEFIKMLDSFFIITSICITLVLVFSTIFSATTMAICYRNLTDT